MLNDVPAHSGSMTWILDKVEEKINSAYRGVPLESLEIQDLDCKTSVANEFLDLMVSQDLKDDSFKKLILNGMTEQCFPLDEDVLTRLA